MFRRNPLLQLTLDRVATLLTRLQSRIWKAPEPVTVEYAGSQAGWKPLHEVRERKLEPVELPFFWGKLYDHSWFRLQLPARRTGRYLRWDDRGEGTLYINSTPYAGFDACHKEWPIPDGVEEAWMEGLCLQRGIWGGTLEGLTPRGSQLSRVELLERDNDAWDLYHDVNALYQLALAELRQQYPDYPQPGAAAYHPPIIEATPLLRRLLRGLEDVCVSLDQGKTDEAKAALGQLYEKLENRQPELKGLLTGHAHIDLVWLWPESNAEYKAVHTFSSVLRLLEEYPEFHFGYSQSASYEAVQKRSPELIDAVRKRVSEGRWEPVGSAYVESDTMIACGEALARGFDIGHEVFREVAGDSSRTLWLPDVFGYSGCLPQIMRQSGVEFFFTTKLTWSAVTRFPFSSFIWRGNDGSEVIAQLTQTSGYNSPADAPTLRSEAAHYQQSDVHDEFLLPVGYGDGGGGPTAEICERIRRFGRLQGLPATRWGRIDDFFATLSEKRDLLPIYQGELYLEYHRGIYTTHGDLKAAFRAAERGLQQWEAAASLTGSGPVDPTPWKRVIFAQFHDYIPGSSVYEVYREGVPELEGIAKRTREEALALLETNNSEPAWFNPLPLSRQHFEDGALYRLPPLSVTPKAAAEAMEATAATASETRIENGMVDARFDAMGRLTSLEVDGHSVRFAEPSNAFWAFHDRPHRYDAWDIDRASFSTGSVDLPAEIDVNAAVEEGVATLCFSRPLGRESRAEMKYLLKPGSPVLEVELTVDWNDQETLVKAMFHTDYLGHHVRYGAPFGSERHPQLPGDHTDEARWEVSGSRYAIVSDDNENEGLFLVTESKYGFSCQDGNLGLSLLRSARLPWSWKDEGITRELPESPFSDVGKKHTIRYAIGHYRPDLPRERQPAALAETLFTPVETVNSHALQSPLLGYKGGESLIACWARPERNGTWILRLHEVLGRNGTITLQLAGNAKAERVDLLGNPVDTFSREANSFPFRGYEIVSLRIPYQLQ